MSSCSVVGLARIRVVGICGSLRPDGFTKQALAIALQGASEAHADVELIDLNEYKLYFCDGMESQSNNAKGASGRNDVAKLKLKLQEAKGVILATPEYHGSFSGVLKNCLDLVGFKEMEGKVVGLVAVSGGSMGGLSALNGLREVARSLHCWVVPEQAAIPQVWKTLSSPEHHTRLRAVGMQTAKFAHLHTSEKAQAFLESLERGWENPGGDGNGLVSTP